MRAAAPKARLRASATRYGWHHGGWDSLERPRAEQRVARAGAQRGLPAAQLLPIVAVVMAGRPQGRLPRAGEHRRAIRQGGALTQPGDEAAERGLAQDLREAFDPSGLH